jgi:phage protein D
MATKLHPYAQLTLDGMTVRVSPLRVVRVSRRLSGSTDELRFAMALNCGLDIASSANDASVSLDMGWGDGGTTVFTGKLQSLEYTLNEVHGIAHGPQKELAQARIDETFIDQCAGDVVQALVDKAGLETGTIDTGIQLPKYLAEGSVSLFEHLHLLARLCGVDVFTDEQGKINFTKREAFTADYTYQYGVNLMDARITQTRSATPGVQVVPESPASQEGDGASSWLVKSSRDLSATEGEGNIHRFSSALCTTKEAAQTAAKSFQRDIERRRIKGKILVMGQPRANPGQVVELKEMPDGNTNGYYEISGVDHALDGIRGFTSTLYLWGQA